MKRAIVIIYSLLMLCILVACGEPTGNNSDKSVPTKPTKNNSYSTKPTKNSGNSSSNASDDIHYISDRRVQYDTANKHHIVFFGLQNMSNDYRSASGTANISIKDESQTVLYQKSISFSTKDFTHWTNQQWDSSRYLCGLYIKDEELQGSASSSGTLSLQVTLDDGTNFSAEELYISDLPAISVEVKLPSIPATFKDVRYSSYTSTVQISKLEYESEVNYDGEATLRFNVILKLVSKSGNSSESSTVAIGYKLYDSEGIVVDSGHIYSDPLAVGESSRDSFTIYDLDPRDKYTLKFSNAS